MSKITRDTQRNNARDISNFLNTQSNNLKDLNGEETLFTALTLAPVTQQVKVVYGMGLVTSRIFQTLPTANKILTLYGEESTGIDPSQTLVLGATLREKVLFKNLPP